MDAKIAADAAQIVNASAPWAALLITGLGVWFAYLQIKANAALSRENTALEAHRQLLCLCIERPELSSSPLMLMKLNRQNFEGISEELTEESERALWFVSYVLNTVEQILESHPGDKAWRATMASHVGYHEALLRVVWPSWKTHYGELLRQFMAIELGLPDNDP